MRRSDIAIAVRRRTMKSVSTKRPNTCSYSQLYAAARGLGFLPWRGGEGTLIPVLNPDYVPFNDPIYGEPYLAVPALHADWAILHVGQADVRQWSARRRAVRRSSALARCRTCDAHRRAHRSERRDQKKSVGDLRRLRRRSGRGSVRRPSVCELRLLCRGRGSDPGIRRRLHRLPQT